MNMVNVRAYCIRPTIAAGASLALAFAFSCSNGVSSGGFDYSGNGGYSSSSAYYVPPPVSSSGAGLGSSSSGEALPQYEWCVFFQEQLCLKGPFANCPPGGNLGNNCPYDSSGGSSSSSGASAGSSAGSSMSSSSYYSSSSAVSSSSSAPALTCSPLPQTQGIAGQPITPPTVKCGDAVLASNNIYWLNSPDWKNPASIPSFYSIMATAQSGDCKYQYVDCGSITISAGSSSSVAKSSSSSSYSAVSSSSSAPVLACSALPQTQGVAGQPITPPTVKCGSATLASSNIYWYNSPDWSKPAAGSYSSIIAMANAGDCNGKTASCSGALTVNAPSSSSVGGYTGSYGSLTYQGQTYKTVKIGTQTWMAENLNYDASGSKCYNNLERNCNKYGRLYNWATAQTVCPSGWHLPTNVEWDALFRYADGTNGTSSPYNSPTAGRHLKAADEWNNDNSFDTYGFAALPGGNGYYDGSFDYDGSFEYGSVVGHWWSNSEYDSVRAYIRIMHYNSEGAGWNISSKTYLFSVRCLQD